MAKKAAYEIICVLIGLSAMSAFLVSCATPAASPGIANSGEATATRQTRRASKARGDQEGFDWSLVQKVCVVDVAELDQSDEIGMMISHHLLEDGVSVTSARAESVEDVRAAAGQAQAEVLIYGAVTDAATLTGTVVNLRATSMEHIITAAAPSVLGQHCSSVMGLAIIRESTTSSTVNSFWYWALGFKEP